MHTIVIQYFIESISTTSSIDMDGSGATGNQSCVCNWWAEGGGARALRARVHVCHIWYTLGGEPPPPPPPPAPTWT